MSDRALFEFAHAAAYMCTPYANLGHPPRETLVASSREPVPNGNGGTDPHLAYLRVLHCSPELNPCLASLFSISQSL